MKLNCVIMNESKLFAGKWMELEINMLCEINDPTKIHFHIRQICERKEGHDRMIKDHCICIWKERNDTLLK